MWFLFVCFASFKRSAAVPSLLGAFLLHFTFWTLYFICYLRNITSISQSDCWWYFFFFFWNIKVCIIFLGYPYQFIPKFVNIIQFCLFLYLLEVIFKTSWKQFRYNYIAMPHCFYNLYFFSVLCVGELLMHCYHIYIPQ